MSTQVTCLSCKRKSNTVEPFWDLSLEFPERYHRMEKPSAATCQQSCSLSEMLSKFTETEALEGCIYACNFCNSKSCNVPQGFTCRSQEVFFPLVVDAFIHFPFQESAVNRPTSPCPFQRPVSSYSSAVYLRCCGYTSNASGQSEPFPCCTLFV